MNMIGKLVRMRWTAFLHADCISLITHHVTNNPKITGCAEEHELVIILNEMPADDGHFELAEVLTTYSHSGWLYMQCLADL